MAPPNDDDSLKKQGEGYKDISEQIKINIGYIEEIDKKEDTLDKNRDARHNNETNRSDKETKQLEEKKKTIEEIVKDGIGSVTNILGTQSPISDFFGKEIVKTTALFGGMALIGKSKDFVSPLADAGPFLKTINQLMPGVNELLQDYTKINNAARQSVLMLNESSDGFEKTLKQYPQVLADVSASTGESRKTLNDLAATVGKIIPGSFKFAEQSADKYGIVVHGLTSPIFTATTALRAFGLSAEQTGSKIIESYLKFGQEPEKYMLSLGKMQQAAKTTGISNEIAMKQITDASSSLAIFGRGADEAANLWAKFSKTLKDGGVPIEQTGQMLNSLTQGIAGMSLQNRALIGMMSGLTQGSSAIGGALKLEFAMRSTGGMEQNLDALTQTLAKFAGGKIITLEQAVKMPELEQQFVMQRQLLGQLTGVSGAEQQNRMLEVLEGVNTGGIGQLEAQKGLKEVMNAGKSLQEQQTTYLENIDKNVSQFLQKSISGSIEDIIKKTTGTGLRPAAQEIRTLGRSTGLAGAEGTYLTASVKSIRDGIIDSGSEISKSLKTVSHDIIETSRSIFKGLTFKEGFSTEPMRLPTAKIPEKYSEEMSLNLTERVPRKPTEEIELSNIGEKRKEMFTLPEMAAEGNIETREKTIVKNVIPTESTLTVKFIGDDEKIIKKVKEELKNILNNSTIANDGGQ